MAMHTTFAIKVINQDCPEGMDMHNCPLRKWLETDGRDLFVVEFGELKPTQPSFMLARKPYTQAIEHMNQICRQCTEKQK